MGEALVRIAVIGCGRMGRVHAANVAAQAGAELAYIFDADPEVAAHVRGRCGAPVAESIGQILGDPAVDAIIVSTPTPTHIELIEAGVTSGKAVLCEKPIDLDIRRVDACLDRIGDGSKRVMIGFQRRFDPSLKELARRLAAGEAGRVAQLYIISRDPAPPPREYMRNSGGLLRDMAIHDFDMARFILRQEARRVTTVAGSLISNDAASVGDHDAAMVILEMEDGAQCLISCFRQASYGCDQRVEAIGTEGMLKVENLNPVGLEAWNAAGTGVKPTLPHSALDRYAHAYREQLGEFVRCVATEAAMTTSYADGRAALVLANAAYESLASNRPVELEGSN